MKFLCLVLAVLVSAAAVDADKGHLRHENARELAACEQICIDFSRAGNGTVLNHGDYVKDEWLDAFGMTIEASTTMGGYTPDGMARIYDTTKQGEDPDLGSPNKKCGGHGVGAGGEPGRPGENCNPEGEGNVLIIQESNKEEPDDNGQGGIMKFSFDCPVFKLRSISLIDVETGEQAFFEIFKADGRAPTIQKISGKGGNSIQRERFDGFLVKDIIGVNIVASNSFGVRSICFCPGLECITPKIDSPAHSPTTSNVIGGSDGPGTVPLAGPPTFIASPTAYPSLASSPSSSPTSATSLATPPTTAPTAVALEPTEIGDFPDRVGSPSAPLDSPAAVFYGRVWYDDNANGKIDDGEKGVKGVKVWLYRYRKTSTGKKIYSKIKSRSVKSNGSFELPLETIVGNSEYYLKFVPDEIAGYEFGPAVPGGDNGVTNKRGNSKRQAIKNGERYEVNAGLVAKQKPASPTSPPPTRTTLPSLPAVPTEQPALAILLGNLTGTVLYENNHPVANAKVSIPALSRSVVTKADGLFAFYDVPEGETLVYASVPRRGQEAFAQLKTLVVAGATRDFTIVPKLRKRRVTVWGSAQIKNYKATLDDFLFAQRVNETLDIGPDNNEESMIIRKCVGVKTRFDIAVHVFLKEDNTVDVTVAQEVFEGIDDCRIGTHTKEADVNRTINVAEESYQVLELFSETFGFGKEYANTQLFIINGDMDPRNKTILASGTLSILDDRFGNAQDWVLDINDTALTVNNLQRSANQSWSYCAGGGSASEEIYLRGQVRVDVHYLLLPDESLVIYSFHRLYEGTSCFSKVEFKGGASWNETVLAGNEATLDVKLHNSDQNKTHVMIVFKNAGLDSFIDEGPQARIEKVTVTPEAVCSGQPFTIQVQANADSRVKIHGSWADIRRMLFIVQPGRMPIPITATSPTGHHIEKTAWINIVDCHEDWKSTTLSKYEFEVDFSIDTDGNNISADRYVDHEWLPWGFSVSAKDGSGSLPRVIDTANPPSRNLGLGSPNERCDPSGPGKGETDKNHVPGENCSPLGNALIIQEPNGNPSVAESKADGGTIQFDFRQEGAIVYEIGLLGIDRDTTVTVVSDLGDDNSRQTSITVPRRGANSFQMVPINAAKVIQLEVKFVGVGAVTSIRFFYEPSPPEMHPGELPAPSSWNWMDSRDFFLYAAGEKGVLKPLPHFDIHQDPRSREALEPKSGWRLMTRDLGKENAAGGNQKFPYFVLYNYLLGMLRVYFYQNENKADYTQHIVSIGYKDGIDANSIFTYTSDNSFTSTFDENAMEKAVIKCATGGWCSADFLMSYDPTPPGTDAIIRIHIMGVDVTGVSLTGGISLEGTIEPGGSVGVPSLADRIVSGAKEGYKYCNCGDQLKALLKKKKENGELEGYEVPDFGVARRRTQAEVGTAILVAKGAAGFIKAFSGNAKGAQPMALQLKGELNLEGELITPKPVGTINMIAPGMSEEPSTLFDERPEYDRPLGVIGLEKRPQFLWSDMNTDGVACGVEATYYELTEPITVNVNPYVDVFDLKVSLVFDWRGPLEWLPVHVFNVKSMNMIVETIRSDLLPGTSLSHPRLAVKAHVRNHEPGNDVSEANEPIVILRTFRPEFIRDPIAVPAGYARAFGPSFNDEEHRTVQNEWLGGQMDEFVGGRGVEPPLINDFACRIPRCDSHPTFTGRYATKLHLGKNSWATFRLRPDDVRQTFAASDNVWDDRRNFYDTYENDLLCGVSAESSLFAVKVCAESRRGPVFPKQHVPVECRNIPSNIPFSLNGNRKSILVGHGVYVTILANCGDGSSFDETFFGEIHLLDTQTSSYPFLRSSCSLTVTKKYNWQWQSD